MKSILPLFLFMCCITSWAQAVNDECVDRTAITVATTANMYSVDTSTATETLDGSCELVGNNNLDVWYEFTMPVNGNVRITNIPSSVSRSLYDSCGGTELVCAFNDGFFFGLTSGTTYVLRIAERADFAGNVDFTIQAFEAAVNDECADRLTITVPTGGTNTYSFDSRTASESVDGSCEGSGNQNLDVWYEFTMPVNGNVRITNIPSTVSRSLYDSCGGTELRCANNDGYFYNLSSGTTYVLRMAQRGLFANPIDFDVEAFETAPNDVCTNRISITVPVGSSNSYDFDPRTANESISASCEGGGSTYLDGWYEFTMPVDGNVKITGIPNTVSRSLFDGCGGTELICGFNDGFFFDLSAGTTYVLRIAERADFSSPITFSVEAFPTIANDDCVDRIPITVTTGGINTYSFDARQATESMDGSCESDGQQNLDVWYEFTMPVNGNVRVTNIPNVTTRSLFDACGGTELGCTNDDGFFFSLTSGTTYVLRLAERADFAGLINFDIEAFEVIENNDCTSAIEAPVGVVAPTTIDFDSRGATESMDASCDNAAQTNMDAWYEITMPFDGDLEVTNANNITRITVFDACGGIELSCFSGNSTVFGLAGGVTYYLRAARRAEFANEDPFDIQALPAPLPTCTTTTEWISGAWDNGTPDLSTNVIIRSAYDTATHGSFSACSVSVDSGITLRVNSGDYVEVAYDINVVGVLDISHEGSLVQRDDAAITTNNGTIRVRKTTPFLKPRDFMIMGSPVSGETREDVYDSAFLVLAHTTGNFVPNADVATAFPSAENFADDNGDFWNPHSGSLTIGEGYLVRPQANYLDGNKTYDLTYTEGSLNNGIVTVPLLFNTTQNDSPNVLGNPYASAISADDFINANPEVETLYFWEHLTPPSPSLPGAGSMNFSMEDISMYNLMGGVAAASDPSGSDTAPNGMIASAQGFGVKASAAGTATFTNSMRRLAGNDTWRSPSEEKNRLWLSVQNSEFNLNNSTLIGFSETCSEGMDSGYDSKRLATVVSLFSMTGVGDELGIQTREAFQSDMKISVGFTSLVNVATEYEISLQDMEGSMLMNATPYLFDNDTGITIDLSQESYRFRSSKTTAPRMFTLFFKETTLGVSEHDSLFLEWYPNPAQERITLLNPDGHLISAVKVYDLLGVIVLEQSLGGVSNATLDITKLASGAYIIKTKSDQGIQTQQLLKR